MNYSYISCNNMGKVLLSDVPPKKARKSITLAVKIDVIKRLEAGERQATVGRAFNLPSSTIKTILLNAPSIKARAKCGLPLTARKLTRCRNSILEKMENKLVLWIKDSDEQLSHRVIMDKAKAIFDDLKEREVVESEVTFQASRGWFDRFKKRMGLRIVSKEGEFTYTIDEEIERSETCDFGLGAVTGFIGCEMDAKEPLIAKDTLNLQNGGSRLHSNMFLDINEIKSHDSEEDNEQLSDVFQDITESNGIVDEDKEQRPDLIQCINVDTSVKVKPDPDGQLDLKGLEVGCTFEYNYQTSSRAFRTTCPDILSISEIDGQRSNRRPYCRWLVSYRYKDYPNTDHHDEWARVAFREIEGRVPFNLRIISKSRCMSDESMYKVLYGVVKCDCDIDAAFTRL